MINWNFPSNQDGQIKGVADAGIENFNGTELSSLARENCQNSLDAALDDSNPQVLVGFDVYISADHGNTPCVGKGKLMKTGVEVETKSRRMLVLKDFADKDTILNQHDVFEYPKYYLNKAYDYLICGAGRSFDAKGEEVMSHGGITVDEVIVPFIKIKAVDNNG